MNCQTCTDPTKYVVGLWDGENGTHGNVFDCHNLNCEVKQSELISAGILESDKQKVIGINESNGIFMDKIKTKRKELLITIMKMSRVLGVSLSTYSNYEQCRESLPIELKDRIDKILKEERIKNRLDKNTDKINMSAKEIASWMKEVKEVYNN